jgi:hypothetical protein
VTKEKSFVTLTPDRLFGPYLGYEENSFATFAPEMSIPVFFLSLFVIVYTVNNDGEELPNFGNKII